MTATQKEKIMTVHICTGYKVEPKLFKTKKAAIKWLQSDDGCMHEYWNTAKVAA